MKENGGFSIDLKLFEVAKTYIPFKGNLPDEQFKLALATKGSFLYLKGVIEALLKELHIEKYLFTPSSYSLFAKGVQGGLIIDNVEMGVFGKIKGSIVENMFLDEEIFAAELDFGRLIKNAQLMPSYKPYNPYAAIHLDLTIPLNQPYATIVERAKKAAPHLVHVTLKDTYKDNITLHMVFASAKRNYTEKEALEELERIKNQILNTKS